MNRKLLVAAVSAAVVAPVVGYGDGHVSWYASVRNAIDHNDIQDVKSFAPPESAQTDISSVAGRLGVRASTEIGNGMTAHGRYEFSTQTDREKRGSELAANNEGGIGDLRIGTVGLSGAFGRVDVGQQWSAYFDTFGTLVSPTFSLGYYLYSSVGGGPFRASNTIKYSNTFGSLYAELDIRMNDDSSPEGSDVAEKLRGDGYGLGLSFAVNENLTIAAAFDSESGADDSAALVTRSTEVVHKADAASGALVPEYKKHDDGIDRLIHDNRSTDTDRVGIAVKGTFGGYWASLGWQNYQTDELDVVTLPAVDANSDGDDDFTDSATLEAGDRPEVVTPMKGGDDIDTILLYGGGNFSEKTNWLLGYSTADRNMTGVNDATQITWGVYHNLGGGLRLFYEGTDLDDEKTNRDGARHLLGMRVDF